MLQAQRNATHGAAPFGACVRYAGALMPDDPKAQPAGSDERLKGRLDSWKEIAAYLGRGIRTVQRWEAEEGLPVHRLPHGKAGSVFAYPEVDIAAFMAVWASIGGREGGSVVHPCVG